MLSGRAGSNPKGTRTISKSAVSRNAEKIVAVNANSKVTLGTLQNRNKHYILTGNIRKEIKRLEDQQWTVVFNWVKARVGIEGNEMADCLAKKVATDDIGVVYDIIPRETIITKVRRTK